MSTAPIQLRGVDVHNLKHIDLDVPRRQMVVFCGVSGSGKTSLALDTLYAEGQRRYIESFSAYTRQFLQRLEKPDAERIDGLPPAIAVTHKNASRSARTTVGTATETIDYLRLIFSSIGQPFCPRCGEPIRRDSSDSVAEQLAALPEGTRFMITFVPQPEDEPSLERLCRRLRRDGFVRAIVGDRTFDLTDAIPADVVSNGTSLEVVVDRLAAGGSEPRRVRDSLETAFRAGHGRCGLLIDNAAPADLLPGSPRTIDDRPWRMLQLSDTLACHACDIELPRLEPKLFSFNSPLGACLECEGFGNVIDIDMDLIVPDENKSIREGAIAPWNTPAYKHELEELLALADDYHLPVDIPFKNLGEEHLRLIREGVPERQFGGLQGFFAWLERRKYKMHLRVFLSRWRSYRTCPRCQGRRLRDEALAVRVSDRNIAEVSAMKVSDAVAFFDSLDLTPRQRHICRVAMQQVRSRLSYLDAVGLGYLALDRTLRTLSGGEAQRVALTSALGSSLVDMLYVLDEPSIGLHPGDVQRLVRSVSGLRDRGNTVVVVEHEEAFLRSADRVVEIGPGAGERGGEIVYDGPLDGMLRSEESLTGDYLAGRRGITIPETRRPTNRGRVRLIGARGNNLQNLDVEFPLGMLCLVTGVSGSGKSTLVQDTLYPALCRKKHQDAPRPQPHDDVLGDGQIDEVVLVDQSPVGRSPRSNPVTYIKAFDAIRNVFADTLEARTHNYSAGHFSFNVEGGRCEHCGGDGFIQIDMQFLPDVFMKCPQCHGRRYRKEILEVTYRGRSIADVLEMTVRQALGFFRGQMKVQKKLQWLIDVGLDYVRLGQPANTLSSGESQRLKLAGYLSASKRNHTLFILDEPTTGLHFSDVVRLLDCFQSLLGVGHSLIVVEHNLQMMRAADYMIDLGPGAAESGGRVVVAGTPEQVAEHPDSVTGRYLRESFRHIKRSICGDG